MNRKSLLVAIILTIVLCVIVISGCTTTTTSPAASSSASTPAGTGAPGGSGPSGAPTVSTSGQTTTISGSQAGQVTMAMEKAGYLVSIESRNGDVGMSTQVMGTDMDLIPYDAASLESSGWYEQQNIQNWRSVGDNTFKIKFYGTTAAPYTIEWTKLPTGAATVSLPQTYSGKGQKVLGPVKLNTGTATFTLSCPDTKTAGFAVALYNADTGSAAYNVGNNAEAGSVQNSYSATKTMNIAAAGDYYIQVTANSAASWSVAVS